MSEKMLRKILITLLFCLLPVIADGAELMVTLTSTDTGSGMARNEVFLDNKLYATYNHVPPQPNVVIFVRINLRPLKKGVHTVQSRCFDAAGNTSWSNTVTFSK